MFNLEEFIDNFNENLVESKDTITSEDDIYDALSQELDRACIYTEDCWEIAKECNPSGDFSVLFQEYGNLNIQSIAYYSLGNAVIKEIDTKEILENLENLKKEEEEEI